MRRKLFLVVILLFASLACDISVPTISLPEVDLSSINFISQDKVTGSGKVAEEDRVIKDYSEITLSGMGNLIMQQGDSEGLKIQAEDNIIQYIRVEVNKGKMVIGIQSGVNISPTKPINFQLKVKSLEGINLTGNGSIESPGLVAKKLTINMSGSGHIKILNIDASTITTHIDGSGDVEVGGKIQSQDISINGSGNYHARDLACDTAKINIPGSGSAYVQAGDKLDANISGSGMVHYWGHPDVKQDVSGSGQVIQEK